MRGSYTAYSYFVAFFTLCTSMVRASYTAYSCYTAFFTLCNSLVRASYTAYSYFAFSRMVVGEEPLADSSDSSISPSSGSAW